MMELDLNLIWASLVATTALRFARWSPGQPDSRRRIVALATICVLALLFPIISVTDDLHPIAAVLEDANSLRRAATILVAHVTAPASGIFAVLLTGASLSFDRVRLSIIGTVAVDRPQHHREPFRVAQGVRPPPAPLA